MFNVIETGLLQQPDLIPDRDRAAYSLRPCLGTSCKAHGQFFFKHYICELQPASRFEDAKDLQKAGLFVRGKVDDTVRYDKIKVIIAVGDHFRIHDPDFEVSHACEGQVLSCPFRHGICQIDSADAAAFADKAGSDIQVEARSAAEIQNLISWPDVAQREGVADAAKGLQELRVGAVHNGRIISQGQCSVFPDGIFELP